MSDAPLPPLPPCPLTPCIEWTGAKHNHGYGTTTRGGKTVYAHRVAYEGAHGPIPIGMELDHLCRNKACVNPAHLEPVTHKENMRRALQARKTVCKRGHPLVGSGASVRVTKHGRRQCRPCSAFRGRIHRRQK